MLILIGLEICDKRAIFAKDTKAIETQLGWFDQGLQQVIELARGPIRESQPEIANSILDRYLPEFLKTVGVGFALKDGLDSTRVWESMKEGRKGESVGVMTKSGGGEIDVLVDRTGVF